jgi:hypothetical protein
MKDELESQRARVSIRPEATWVCAAYAAEPEHRGVHSQCRDGLRTGRRGTPAPSQTGWVADVESEAYFRRHNFSFL